MGLVLRKWAAPPNVRYDFHACQVDFMLQTWGEHLSHPDILAYLITFYAYWVDVATEAGRLEDAYDILEQVDKALVPRLEGYGPEDAVYLKNLLTYYKLRGDVLVDDGFADLALQQIPTATRVIRQLRAQDQLEPWVTSLALHLKTRAYVCAENFATLVRTCEAALREDENAQEDFQVWFRLAIGHWWLSLLEPTQTSEARRHTEEAKKAFRKVFASADSNRDFLQARKAYADFLLDLGEIEEARAQVNKCQILIQTGDASLSNRAFLAFLEARADRLQGKATPTATADLGEVVQSLIEDSRGRPLREGGSSFFYFVERRRPIVELILRQVESDPTEALETWLKVESVATLVRQIGGETPTADQIQAHLGAGGALVYLATREHTILLAVDSKQVQYFLVQDRFAISAPRRALLGALQTPPDQASNPAQRTQIIEERSRELGEMLIPRQLEAWIRARSELSIVDAGTLGYLPFECLRLSDGSILGLESAISYASTLTLQYQLRRRQRSSLTQNRALDAWVFGAPDFSAEAELTPLPLPKAFGRSLGELHAPERFQLTTGQEVTLAKLREAPRARVAQFLTHGGRVGGQELYAALHVAPSPENPDGRLTSSEIAETPTAPLVILTACSAGQGPQRVGDATASDLVGAMIRAGASTVIAPKRDISFLGTLHLTEELHESLTSGRSPAQALCDARRLMSGSKRWQDPYYHSLLHAHGSAHAPYLESLRTYRPSSASGMPRWALIATALFLVFLVWRTQGRRTQGWRTQPGDMDRTES